MQYLTIWSAVALLIFCYTVWLEIRHNKILKQKNSAMELSREEVLFEIDSITRLCKACRWLRRLIVVCYLLWCGSLLIAYDFITSEVHAWVNCAPFVYAWGVFWTISGLSCLLFLFFKVLSVRILLCPRPYFLSRVFVLASTTLVVFTLLQTQHSAETIHDCSWAGDWDSVSIFGVLAFLLYTFLQITILLLYKNPFFISSNFSQSTPHLRALMKRAFFSALLQILTDWVRYVGFLFYRDLYLQATAMKLNFIANYLALVIALPEWRYFLCPCCYKESPYTESQEVWYASNEALRLDDDPVETDSQEPVWGTEFGLVKVTIDEETFWCKESIAQVLQNVI